MNSVLQKFSSNCKAALHNAFDSASRLNSPEVNPSDILAGIIKQKGCIGSEILLKSKTVQMSKTYQSQNSPKLVSPENKTSLDKIKLSKTGEKLLERAILIAASNSHLYVGTEHLLAAFLEIKDSEIDNLFLKFNIDKKQLANQIDIVLNSVSKFSDLTESIESLLYSQSGFPFAPKQSRYADSALKNFGTDLTAPEIQKNIDPVIGRQSEINRLIQILCRKTKNNPLLLGDAGVGKTAIVEGLAKKISLGEVPDILIGKKIYSLDLGAVIAGSSFRGEFENRLKLIIDEVKQNPNIILFIDEIHNLVGAGSLPGSLDASNLLKPALSKGQVRLIGATTLDEYKKYLEADAALERRFQPIIIDQPSVEKTIEILQGIKDSYEKYHRVKITDDAIAAAANLSHRYLPDKFLPDKAIDLLDEAASSLKILNTDLKAAEIKKIELKFNELKTQKENYLKADEYDFALKIRAEQNILLAEIKAVKNQIQNLSQNILGEITAKDITRTISETAGIPLEDLLAEERTKFLNLEKILSQKIIGQPDAVFSVAEFIRRSRTGIADANRPIGSFIFIGPSGVGKTELAKVLAETIFLRPDSLIRIDMSEFAESFNASKLIGSPAGYVGYRDQAALTDSVRKKPYSVVLFDEIEKAHPQIFNLMLQILEDGTLTDATGKKINFKNTIIIMTSNLGTKQFHQISKLGFGSRQTETLEEKKLGVLKKLNDSFNTEFLNRIDKIIVFNPLSLSDIKKIARLQLTALKDRLAAKNLALKISQLAVDLIAKQSFSPEQGARAVRKKISEHVENKIAKILLARPNQKTFSLVASKGKIVVK